MTFSGSEPTQSPQTVSKDMNKNESSKKLYLSIYLSIYLSMASIRTFLCSLRQKCYNCNQCFLYPLLDIFTRARCRRNFSLDLARASHTNSTQRCDFPKTCSAIVLVHALKAPPREDVQVESGKTFSNATDLPTSMETNLDFAS